MHQDFLMRQIEFISTAVGERVFFWKEQIRIEVKSEVRQLESDLLYVLLCDLISKKSINEAENLLFEMLDPNNQEQLTIATDFYNKLNTISNDELENADFSREEIERGRNEVLALFDLPI